MGSNLSTSEVRKEGDNKCKGGKIGCYSSEVDHRGESVVCVVWAIQGNQLCCSSGLVARMAFLVQAFAELHGTLVFSSYILGLATLLVMLP